MDSEWLFVGICMDEAFLTQMSRKGSFKCSVNLHEAELNF